MSLTTQSIILCIDKKMGMMENSDYQKEVFIFLNIIRKFLKQKSITDYDVQVVSTLS